MERLCALLYAQCRGQERHTKLGFFYEVNLPNGEYLNVLPKSMCLDDGEMLYQNGESCACAANDRVWGYIYDWITGMLALEDETYSRYIDDIVKSSDEIFASIRPL